MNKQEEIKKAHLITIVTDHAFYRRTEEDTVNRILSYLHSQGVVIKVERELPEVPLWAIRDGIEIKSADIVYKLALQDMLRAGYVATEPLIKEK